MERKARMKRGFFLLGAVIAGSAFAQDIPDTVYTLGLSPRGEGMGGAISALAYDPSATIYNPAGLALVGRREAMLTLRSQPDVQTTLQGQTSNIIEFREPRSGNLGFGLVGFTLPFTRNGVQTGTLGVSFARIGHYSESLTGQIADPDTGNAIRRTDSRKIDTDLLTVAYGFGRRKINFGVGLVVAQQRYDFDYKDELLGQDIPAIESHLSETGTGIGAIVGVEVPGPLLSYAVSYRTEMRLNGQGAFKDYSKNIPARLRAGLAYRILQTGDPGSGSGGNLIGAADVEHFFSTNGGLDDERRSATNFHVGLEYSLYWSRMIIPVRVGYQSNQAGNTRLFDDENFFTVGVGYRPINDQFGIDVTLGFGKDNRTSTVVGVVYRFDR